MSLHAHVASTLALYGSCDHSGRAAAAEETVSPTSSCDATGTTYKGSSDASLVPWYVVFPPRGLPFTMLWKTVNLSGGTTLDEDMVDGKLV